MGGWIKVHRKLIDSQIFANPELLKLWLLCLLKANHTKNWVQFKNLVTPIEILPGQFITGRQSICHEFYRNQSSNIKSCRTVWRYLKTLEKLNMMSIKSTTKYSLFTINKWSQYQSNPNNCPTGVKQDSNKVPANDLQLSTNKNDNNEENDKKRLNLNGVNIPEKLVSDEFIQLYYKYMQDVEVKYKQKVTSNQTGVHFSQLIKLKNTGNKPEEVIAQTIAGGYKIFFPVKDYSNSFNTSDLRKPSYLNQEL